MLLVIAVVVDLHDGFGGDGEYWLGTRVLSW